MCLYPDLVDEEWKLEPGQQGPQTTQELIFKAFLVSEESIHLKGWELELIDRSLEYEKMTRILLRPRTLFKLNLPNVRWNARNAANKIHLPENFVVSDQGKALSCGTRRHSVPSSPSKSIPSPTTHSFSFWIVTAPPPSA